MEIVLLGSLRWLKPETTLVEMGSRAEILECLGLKPCWKGRIPSAFTKVGRRSRAPVSLMPGKAARWGGRNGPVNAASLLSRLGL